MVKYLLLPVVDDTSLETMLEAPSNHPSLKSVELYLNVKPTSDDVIVPGSCSSKRQRIQQPQEDTDLRHPPVKLEDKEIADFGNGNTHGGGDIEMRDKNSGSDDAVVNLSHNDSNSGVLKPCLSSLWLEDHDLRVGLCFKDGDELKKAVDWCSIKGQQNCIISETGKDEYTFECVRWKCKWSLAAAKMEKHGLFEIIKYTCPHTCLPIEPKDLDTVFEGDEIERVVRLHPTLTIAELEMWWFEKFGYKLETSEMQERKQEVIRKVFGDWDQSFEDLPKLMSALRSSNGLLVDWKYDLLPNPKFASFCGVFWTFPQSVRGFTHCRPLIEMDYKDLNGKYPLKLMIASGVDADYDYFPLAFAVTKQVSSDTWRWFLAQIREKVTQRKDLCLVSGPHPDILAVINEPGSLWQEPWAYHRFCLKQFCSQFYRVYPTHYHLKSLVKQAGLTSQTEEFDSCMKEIKEKNPEARRWLDQFPPHQWALSHDNGRRYENMKIKKEALFAVCRGFELSDHVVTGSVLLLFDQLRNYFDESFSRSRNYLNCGVVYTKPVSDRLEEFRTSSLTYKVMPLENNNAFQVMVPPQTNEWIVQLTDGGTCTCGGFQSKKFPCLHALAVCKKLKINPLTYVDDCYTVGRYYKTYAATFAHVPELLAWPEAFGVPTLFPPVITTQSSSR